MISPVLGDRFMRSFESYIRRTARLSAGNSSRPAVRRFNDSPGEVQIRTLSPECLSISWSHRGPLDRGLDEGLRNEQGRSSDIMLADQRQGLFDNARTASLSSGPVPADLLTIRAPAPDWFRWAISRPRQSQFVTVGGCRIHYLVW